MKIEIRKSFEKDADKLPAPFQRQLALIVSQMEKAAQPSDFITKTSKQNWFVSFTAKKFTGIFLDKLNTVVN